MDGLDLLTPDPSPADVASPDDVAGEGTTPPLLGFGEVPEWMDRGLCGQTDPELFFPEKGGESRTAKSVCANCPVMAQCLDYALDNDERFGIWGGLSERERRSVKQAMAEEGGTASICADCSACFTNELGLSRHRLRAHDRPPVEDLPCPHCDHIGKGRQGLSVHITRTHPELRTAS